MTRAPSSIGDAVPIPDLIPVPIPDLIPVPIPDLIPVPILDPTPALIPVPVPDPGSAAASNRLFSHPFRGP
jgi:hypothetical protein